jgi:hypothetical protein
MRLPFITNYLLYRGALSGKFDSTIEKRGSNGILGTNNYAWLSLEMFADFNRCDRHNLWDSYIVSNIFSKTNKRGITWAQRIYLMATIWSTVRVFLLQLSSAGHRLSEDVLGQFVCLNTGKRHQYSVQVYGILSK